MPYDHLAQFVNSLAASSQLDRVPEVVSRVQEINLRARQGFRDRRHAAVLFERPDNAKFPAVANVFSHSRLLEALDAKTPQDVIRRVSDTIAAWQRTMGDGLPTPAAMSKLGTRFQKTAFSQQVVRLGKDIDLWEFPFSRWSGESAPTFSNALVQVPQFEGSRPAFDTPYLQVIDRDALVIHWTAHDQGPAAFERARREGKPLPVAIILGADPALQWAAQAPRIHGVEPLFLAAMVRGHGLNLVRGRTIELDVPADAEFVFEGYVDPLEPAEASGTVATGSATFVERSDLPRVRITAITHRANAIVPLQIRHRSPCEADAFNELSMAMLEWDVRRHAPGITGLKLVTTSEHRRVLFASVAKEFPGHARQVMHMLWGHRWLVGVKCIVVVDDGTALTDEAVWQAVAMHTDPERDSFVVKGTADFDDQALWPGYGSKLGIDATRKRPDEGGLDWPVTVTGAE